MFMLIFKVIFGFSHIFTSYLNKTKVFRLYFSYYKVLCDYTSKISLNEIIPHHIKTVPLPPQLRFRYIRPKRPVRCGIDLYNCRRAVRQFGGCGECGRIVHYIVHPQPDQDDSIWSRVPPLLPPPPPEARYSYTLSTRSKPPFTFRQS